MSQDENMNRSKNIETLSLSRPSGFENARKDDGESSNPVDMFTTSFLATSGSKNLCQFSKRGRKNRQRFDGTVVDATENFMEVGTRLGYGMNSIKENMDSIISQMGVDLFDK